MKKLPALLLTLTMALSLAACGDGGGSSGSGGSSSSSSNSSSGTTKSNSAAKTESDLVYVKDKGTLVVGITEFEPMDYRDASGNWIGFDADMAKKFAENLGVKAEFQVIEWNNKVQELTGKSIDMVWNGMTLNDEVISDMECSKAYCNNAQVVVVPADKAEEYQTLNSVKGLSFAVEAGSVGKQQVETMNCTYTEVADQKAALLEVSTGASDAAVIDLLMAAAMVGEGTDYADLTYTVNLNKEEYGVGFRKGSDLAASLNAFLKTTYNDGSMMKIAEQYGVQASIIAQ